MDELCALLPWDSEFFGFPVARVTATVLTEQSAAAMVEWCAQRNVKCLYLRAKPDCAETGRIAASAGFRFVDTRMDFELEVESVSPHHSAGVSFRPARETDLSALRQIARNAHRDTRFFFDGRFNPSRAEDLYAKWIEVEYARKGGKVWVAEVSAGEPAGYVSWHIDSENHCGRVGLLGVDAAHRGRGFGRGLLNTAIEWSLKNGFTTVRVATQARNVPAQRLYQTIGFRTVEIANWYHRWF